MSTRQELLIGALAVAVLAGGIYGLARLGTLPRTTEPTSTTAPVLSIPPYTDAVKAQLAASKGFQYLVSYTDKGFEPQTLTIKKGQTVRFTNNTGKGLWVAAAGTAHTTVYPGRSSCGGSLFDSCKILKAGEFWEFTFTAAGSWSYKNNTDTTMTGAIVVK